MAWSMGLIESMNNIKLHMISTDAAVVIKDVYPKSKYHYLVLPWEDISNIYHLSDKHLHLLIEMGLLAKNVIEISGENEKNFKIGYHACPSMERLHLHVISKDFNSSYLKTKKQWNSFNTDSFISHQFVYDEIKQHGKIDKFSDNIINGWQLAKLKCHICDYYPKNMPDLKTHILKH